MMDGSSVWRARASRHSMKPRSRVVACAVVFALTHAHDACGQTTRAFARPNPSKVFVVDAEANANERCEQIHLTPTARGEVVATWTSREAYDDAKTVTYVAVDDGVERRAKVSSDSYTTQICFGSRTLFSPRMGARAIDEELIVKAANTSAWADANAANFRKVESMEDVVPSGFFASAPNDKSACMEYNNPDGQYSSPVIHTATMTHLVGGSRVRYQLPGSAMSRTFVVPTVPTRHPMHHQSWTSTRIAVIGDTGQTEVTREVLTHVVEALSDAQVLIHTGDLAYADGFAPRWDNFGRLMEFVTSKIPMLSVPGNHDVSGNGLESIAYAMRYPSPYVSSKSPSRWFWSYEVGHAHVIGLNSYANTEVGVFDGANSIQMRWLREDLSRINREYTPWVIVVFHVPWYNSNRGHFKEAERARLALESALYDAGVDLVLNGHIHAYERSKPVYNNTVNACGPVHIVIGDGGNYEGPYGEGWIDPQPEWSAFREGSFGAGSLLIHNDTHATWEWRRTTCVANSTADASYFEKTGNASSCRTIPDVSAQAMQPVDVVVLRRDVATCPNKLTGNATRENGDSAYNADSNPSTHVTTLIVSVVVLLALWIITSIFLIHTLRALKHSRAYRSPLLLANADYDLDSDTAVNLQEMGASIDSDKF